MGYTREETWHRTGRYLQLGLFKSRRILDAGQVTREAIVFLHQSVEV